MRSVRVGRAATYLALVGAFACSDSDPRTEGKVREDSMHGGLVSPCQETQLVPVAWTDSAELGVSPETAFGSMLGTCSAPFRWDATAYGTRSVEPRTSAGEMTVTVEADQASARVARPPPGGPAICVSLLVDVTVALRSSDGVIADTGRGTLSLSPPGGRPMQLTFSVDLDDAGGMLEVGLSEYEEASLQFSVEGPAASCTGRVGLLISGHVPGTNMGFGGGAFPGSWSKDSSP